MTLMQNSPLKSTTLRPGLTPYPGLSEINNVIDIANITIMVNRNARNKFIL